MKYVATRMAEKITANMDLLKPDERYRIGLTESWVSIAGNFLLTLLKIIFGLLTNSIALIADAVHSASDIFSSLVVLAGFHMSKKKPDREHPHGHGRTEYLAGLVISVMLIGAGAAFIYSSYNRLIEGVTARPSLAAIAAVIAAILIKEFLYYFSSKLGALINSDTLAGDAWHHRSDSLSSALVLVALIGGYFGLYTLDAFFGFAIALFVIYAGIKIARNSCSRLLGTAPAEELQKNVVCSAREIDGVIDAHNLEVHDYGSWKVITMHIEINGDLSLDKAHDIAHRVENHVSKNYYCNTIVHLDPR